MASCSGAARVPCCWHALPGAAAERPPCAWPASWPEWQQLAMGRVQRLPAPARRKEESTQEQEVQRAPPVGRAAGRAGRSFGKRLERGGHLKYERSQGMVTRGGGQWGQRAMGSDPIAPSHLDQNVPLVQKREQPEENQYVT